MSERFVSTTKLSVENGVYIGIINYKDKSGKYKKKKINTNLKERGNKKEAQKILDEATEEFERQLQNDDYGKKVVEVKEDFYFLDYIDKFVENKKQQLQPEVYDGYRHCFKIMTKYFNKSLKLKDVTYKTILGYYDYLRNTRKNKNVTIKHHAIILSPALREAYRDDLIPKNPYEFLPKLKREKSKMNYYSQAEIETLFNYTDNTDIGLIVRIAAFYGFRKSEIIGLRWQSIDFDKKVITIEHKVITSKSVKIYATDTLKTFASNRTLPLFKDIENMLLARKDEIEHNKKIYGQSYNSKFLDYVFVDDMGDLMLPDRVTKTFQRIIKKNELKHIRFHDLRHSCASLLVSKGVPMKNIQEWLGHANFNTTADVYSHLDFSAKEMSASVIENALTSGKEATNEELEKEIAALKKLVEEKEKMLNSNKDEMC